MPWLWLAAFSPFFLAFLPAPARAQAVIFHAGHVVPANGGVLVLVPTTGLLGAGAKAVPTTIEVSQAGKAVPGRVQDIGWVENLRALSLDTTEVVGDGVVWTPAEPLQVGATYDITVSVRGEVADHASIKAGAAWEMPAPEATLDAQLQTRDTGQQQEHCCAPFRDGTGHQGCFVSRYAVLPAVAPDLVSSEPEEHLEQLVYSYRAFSQADDMTLWDSGYRTYDSPLDQVPFLSPADEYCIEVEAMHIVSQALFRWSRCLPASDLPSPIPDPTQGIAEGLRIEHCSVPKYGDLLQWCDINREVCASKKSHDCAEYQPLCSVSLPDALDIILSIEAARDHAKQAPDGGPPTLRAHEPAGRALGGGGCQVRSGAAEGLAWLLPCWPAFVFLSRARGPKAGRRSRGR